ncbi:PIG-L deacetylase family protein [Halospina sp. K52047b]|uniref:PIG-L deacetylase family protein n=1 Tax=Halospina sp. K52047b TaxID=2614160 RepID=UPI00124A9550|nr:PIG-L deacetylase family protein [Halospina sp. K52047b]KAA8976809.1 PIG-L family deacetylase [Halospina sp. K52047b]
MAPFYNVLVLAPHTDDAELGCGGTIARLIEEGASVTVAAFSTAAESLPSGMPSDQLEREFKEGMSRLGVLPDHILVYGYQVRRLSYSRQEVLDEIVAMRRQLKPDMVLMPASTDLHQDHQVVHNEGLRAFKDITIWGYELPWNHIDFAAQAFMTLEKHHLEAKWHALEAYESQVAKGRRYFQRDLMFGLASVRGLQVNTNYAESFEVYRIRM